MRELVIPVDIGIARQGDCSAGGCLWLDWNLEFQPVPGMKQIVGHTKRGKPGWRGDNLCLDTGLHHYAIIEDGEVTTHYVT